MKCDVQMSGDFILLNFQVHMASVYMKQTMMCVTTRYSNMLHSFLKCLIIILLVVDKFNESKSPP